MAATLARVSPTSLAGVLLGDARDASKPKVTFGSLYASRPTVIIFLRRLGCPICRVFAREVESIRPAIESVGCSAVCISFEYLGEGSDADRSFEKGGFFRGPIFVNSDRSMYDALFKRKALLDNFFGLLEVPKEVKKKASAPEIGGNLAGAMSGFQLGGTFVIAPGGRVVLDHRQSFYGDDPKAETILAACASSLPCPAEKLEMLEAVAEMPPPRSGAGEGGGAAVCEECLA